MYLSQSVNTALKRSLGQVNFSTPVCQSFCSQGDVARGVKGGERGVVKEVVVKVGSRHLPGPRERDPPWTQRQTPPGRDGH